MQDGMFRHGASRPIVTRPWHRPVNPLIRAAPGPAQDPGTGARREKLSSLDCIEFHTRYIPCCWSAWRHRNAAVVVYHMQSTRLHRKRYRLDRAAVFRSWSLLQVTSKLLALRYMIAVAQFPIALVACCYKWSAKPCMVPLRKDGTLWYEYCPRCPCGCRYAYDGSIFEVSSPSRASPLSISLLSIRHMQPLLICRDCGLAL